ncbi:GNAT family N-acetyltransferase [Pseudoroseicyclus tamaricis]|uniref:GNAT family N-acetyltransferase n=1 Tax=Pseudoroseicyclus tamaricis TaxID=2705421 RepID=A0A6B2JJV6_9RHOB|nr:GNAT family N-acetyltransferase [Pseudoroseicyclus tamaricis]NDV01723.1 GNAT family N-acetyltransferase [Pseudoroseicyclus tamaricis]
MPRDHAATDLALPLQQSPMFAAALARAGAKAQHLTLENGGVILCQCLMVRRWGLSLAPRGPVFRPGLPDVMRLGLLAKLAREGLRLAEPDEAEGLRAAGFSQVLTPGWVAEWDIRPGEAELRARMAQKWRNGLHRAEAAGLQARWHAIGSAARPGRAAGELFAREAAQRKVRRYRALPAGLWRGWPGAEVLELKAEGEVAAQMLFLPHGRVVTYQMAWASEAGRRTNAHRLGLLLAARRFAAGGAERMDLGAIDAAAPGLMRFKLGTGARARQLGGSWLRLPGLGRR